MFKIIDWCINKIELYGFKKCIIFVGAVIGSIFAIWLLWGLEKDVKVEPMGMNVTLTEPRKISVIRTGKIGDSLSLMSITKELVSGISSETEAISTFDELMSLSNDVKTKKEKLVIPEKAGYSELGGMELYIWKRTGRHLLTDANFSEIHLVFVFAGQYIEGSIDVDMANIALGYNFQVGKLN